MSVFKEKVLTVVKNIPKGETLSYGEVAVEAGHKGAARAVATVMSSNYDLSVPCHRVIRSDGQLGDYNRGGTQEKRRLLINEGVVL